MTKRSGPTKCGHNYRKRSAARLYAVQALFQMEVSGQSSESIKEEFITYRFGEEIDNQEILEGDIDFFSILVDDAVNYQALIDQMTKRALVDKWPLSRIDPTIRSLFRAAGAELIRDQVPPKVIINEFIDIACAFFPSGQESKFVNGVLDHMAREVRPDDFTIVG
ncbi:MAG: transcription antitermination factor NusB [Aestuariivita sp.]|nr:transcription antitermination factor NusB [Aestuariivita sp.]